MSSNLLVTLLPSAEFEDDDDQVNVFLMYRISSDLGRKLQPVLIAPSYANLWGIAFYQGYPLQADLDSSFVYKLSCSLTRACSK